MYPEDVTILSLPINVFQGNFRFSRNVLKKSFACRIPHRDKIQRVGIPGTAQSTESNAVMGFALSQFLDKFNDTLAVNETKIPTIWDHPVRTGRFIVFRFYIRPLELRTSRYVMIKIGNTPGRPPFRFVVMIDDSRHVVAIGVAAEVALNAGSVYVAAEAVPIRGFVYAASEEIVSPCYQSLSAFARTARVRVMGGLELANSTQF